MKEIWSIPIWKFLGCGNLAARLHTEQACNNLALAFARCTQPCYHPLQSAHNLAIIPCNVHTALERLYVSCTTLHDGCKVVKLYPTSKSHTYSVE